MRPGCCYLGRVVRSLRFRRGSGARGGSPLADPASLRERIDELTARNREERSVELERELLSLRHRLGSALVREQRRAPADARSGFPHPGPDGLAAVRPEAVDGALVRDGILTHGYVLVREAVPRAEALRMAERIEEAFSARQEGTGEEGLYEEFMPDLPYGPIAGRSWITAGGGLLAADSPGLSFEMIDLFQQARLDRVIAEFLGEPTTFSVQKSTLRRADPGPAGGWHQDGSFMGKTRALNVWMALSDCGVDAPGLDFVPARIDYLLETGGEGSGAEHLGRPKGDEVSAKGVLISPAAVEHVAGERGVVRPPFRAGDVVLFDDRFLHRTGSEPDMPNPRYAIESWFFGASGFPRRYVPLAL